MSGGSGKYYASHHEDFPGYPDVPPGGSSSSAYNRNADMISQDCGLSPQVSGSWSHASSEKCYEQWQSNVSSHYSKYGARNSSYGQYGDNFSHDHEISYVKHDVIVKAIHQKHFNSSRIPSNRSDLCEKRSSDSYLSLERESRGSGSFGHAVSPVPSKNNDTTIWKKDGEFWTIAPKIRDPNTSSAPERKLNTPVNSRYDLPRDVSQNFSTAPVGQVKSRDEKGYCKVASHDSDLRREREELLKDRTSFEYKSQFNDRFSESNESPGPHMDYYKVQTKDLSENPWLRAEKNKRKSQPPINEVEPLSRDQYHGTSKANFRDSNADLRSYYGPEPKRPCVDDSIKSNWDLNRTHYRSTTSPPHERSRVKDRLGPQVKGAKSSDRQGNQNKYSPREETHFSVDSSRGQEIYGTTRNYSKSDRAPYENREGFKHKHNKGERKINRGSSPDSDWVPPVKKPVVPKPRKKKSKAIQVAIVPSDFPTSILTKVLSSSILKALMKLVSNQMTSKIKPQFRGFDRKSGFLIISCENNETVSWLTMQENKLQSLSGIKIRILLGGYIPANVLFTILICNHIDKSEDVMNQIASENPHLNVIEWQLLKKEIVGPSKTLLTVSVDYLSILTLMEDSERLGTQRYNVMYKSKEILLKPVGVIPSREKLTKIKLDPPKNTTVPVKTDNSLKIGVTKSDDESQHHQIDLKSYVNQSGGGYQEHPINKKLHDDMNLENYILQGKNNQDQVNHLREETEFSDLEDQNYPLLTELEYVENEDQCSYSNDRIEELKDNEAYSNYDGPPGNNDLNVEFYGSKESGCDLQNESG